MVSVRGWLTPQLLHSRLTLIQLTGPLSSFLNFPLLAAAFRCQTIDIPVGPPILNKCPQSGYLSSLRATPSGWSG
jgi:hypothetical protein